MEKSDPMLLVHAYCDDELDAVNALSFEARIASDPRLAAECERIRALKRSVDRLPRAPVPVSLRRTVEKMGSPGAARSSFRPTWTAMAASIVAACFLSAGTTWMVLSPGSQTLSEEVLGSHMRAMISQPVDVASSDRHTVKPWFNGKVTLAPKVPDFTAQGFPLLGGRVDVIGRTPVPALVYKRRQHLISLTAVPEVSKSLQLGSNKTSNGFNLVSWTEGALTYWAVSDVNSKDLEE